MTDGRRTPAPTSTPAGQNGNVALMQWQRIARASATGVQGGARSTRILRLT